VIDPGRPLITVDSVDTHGGPDNGDYPTTCTPQ